MHVVTTHLFIILSKISKTFFLKKNYTKDYVKFGESTRSGNQDIKNNKKAQDLYGFTAECGGTDKG